MKEGHLVFKVEKMITIELSDDEDQNYTKDKDLKAAEKIEENVKDNEIDKLCDELLRESFVLGPIELSDEELTETDKNWEKKLSKSDQRIQAITKNGVRSFTLAEVDREFDVDTQALSKKEINDYLNRKKKRFSYADTAARLKFVVDPESDEEVPLAPRKFTEITCQKLVETEQLSVQRKGPILIDAHHQQPKRRKSIHEVAPIDKVAIILQKKPAPKRRMTFCGDEASHLDGTAKKRRHSTDKQSKENQKNAEKMKQLKRDRLREIAEKESAKKKESSMSTTKDQRIQCIPKVKMTHNTRGANLAKDLSSTPRIIRRNSINEPPNKQNVVASQSESRLIINSLRETYVNPYSNIEEIETIDDQIEVCNIINFYGSNDIVEKNTAVSSSEICSQDLSQDINKEPPKVLSSPFLPLKSILKNPSIKYDSNHTVRFTEHDRVKVFIRDDPPNAIKCHSTNSYQPVTYKMHKEQCANNSLDLQ